MTKLGDKIREVLPGNHGAQHTGSATTGAYDSFGKDSITPGGTLGNECAPCAATNTTATTKTTTATTGTGATHQGEGGVCGQEYFTKVEDRPVVKERVERLKEHRPVEKEFVVETRATGVTREATEGRATEHLGTTERVISEAKPKSPCE